MYKIEVGTKVQVLRVNQVFPILVGKVISIVDKAYYVQFTSGRTYKIYPSKTQKPPFKDNILILKGRGKALPISKVEYYK